MKGKRFTEEQSIQVLKEAKSGLQVTDPCPPAWHLRG